MNQETYYLIERHPSFTINKYTFKTFEEALQKCKEFNSQGEKDIKLSRIEKFKLNWEQYR